MIVADEAAVVGRTVVALAASSEGVQQEDIDIDLVGRTAAT